MATKQLLQILLKSREGIKSGAIKVKDVVEEYLTSTGARTISPEERYTINKEFTELAPSNVIDDVFGDFQALQDDAGDVAEKIRGPNVQKAGEMSDTPVTDKIMKDRDVELRGDESFGEILEKFKTKEEGIGSLFFKDKDGFDDRAEAAEFVRKMRGAGIKNEDIRKIFKENPPYKKGSAFLGQDRDKMILDLEPGKRAATTLARAADMGADTKVKQELLSELDEMKMDKGPRFFQEEYMGFDDFRSAVDAKKIEVNNAIVEDLEAKGVSDEVVTSIMGKARETANKPFYTSGEEFIDIIKDELDFNDITNYDLEFYKKYFRELESLMRKPEPRFEHGGVV